jgi:hypothetical protein
MKGTGYGIGARDKGFGAYDWRAQSMQGLEFWDEEKAKSHFLQPASRVPYPLSLVP